MSLKILQDLLETNIRQRGIGNPNPIKLGRCIKELERIYGIHQGNGSNQYEQNPKVSDKATVNQSDIAKMVGISGDTLNNYKKLTELIPELEDLVETGMVTNYRSCYHERKNGKLSTKENNTIWENLKLLMALPILRMKYWLQSVSEKHSVGRDNLRQRRRKL